MAAFQDCTRSSTRNYFGLEGMICSARASRRYGGDEFVIILPKNNQRLALFVAERLRRAVEHARFYVREPRCAQGINDQRWLSRLRSRWPAYGRVPSAHPKLLAHFQDK